MSWPILSTKLFAPEISDKHVDREALVEKLISGINANNKLTLVSAPAGYGKTTLVLEFLKAIDRGYAWVSLDEGDNELSQFLVYFIEALRRAGVTIGNDTAQVASDINLSLTPAPMTHIINDIVNFSGKIVLVLDDFHLINSPQVQNAVKFLVERQPVNLHLVIITREDPRFPLAQLRVQRKITEIRMKDLSFTTLETENFLNKVLKLNLTGEAVKSIASKAEGWAAGLQLAGLSLSGLREEDANDFVRLLGDTHKYIIDYLVEEVISRQSTEIREFLCKTSILERMSGALCDSLLGRNDSKQLLWELEKANLFLIPLDSKREWYRYHHLFADSLRTELTKKEEEELYGKAALWFFQNNFRQESVNYALKSGEKHLSLRLIEENTEQAFKSAQLSTLLRWMSLIPEDMIKNSEILSVRKAWALYITGRAGEAMEHLNTLGEDFIERATPHNKGLMLSLKALRARELGNSDSEILAEEALKFLQPFDPISRISTLNTLGRSKESLGKSEEAVETFRKAYREGRRLGFTFITTISLNYLGTNLNWMGKRREAIELYTEYIESMTRELGKPLPFIGLIYIGLAELYYESNELEEARGYMEKGMELCQSISYNWMKSIGMLNGRIRFALGYREEAIRSMEDELRASEDKNLQGSIVALTALLIEMLTADGQKEKALQYGEKMKVLLLGGALKEFPGACLSYARLLLHGGFREEALSLLKELEMEILIRNKIRDLASAYVLYAEIHYLERDFEKLDYYIDRAVELSEREGYYRVFLENTGELSSIVKYYKERNKPFLNKVAQYLEPQVEGKQREESKTVAYGEKLSRREVEILRLIGKGMSNSEIAKELYISINTTQWHISHIYSKLDVKSRTQAAMKARELGVL